MSDSLQAIKDFIDHCTAAERLALYSYIKAHVGLTHPLEIEWGIDAESILTAIHRAPDLTRRGVRGVIAEAIFHRDVLPLIENVGWKTIATPVGDWPYDAEVEKNGRRVTIQVKLQRLDKGQPKRYWPKRYEQELFVVEVQKTRTGTKKNGGAESDAAAAELIDTRPYRFGEFDILAVNMHPATKQWTNFRYTIANWLLPRQHDETLIEIMQPVSLVPNEVWTDDLATCLEWFLKGEAKRVLDNPPPRRKRKN